MRGGSCAVSIRFHGDGELGEHRGCIFLEDGLDLHIAVRHGELIVLDGYIAADDLPLLKVVALVGRSGQGDLRTSHGLVRRCGSRAVAVRFHGDGVLGRRVFGYRNRQLLLIVAHAVESSNGKLGGSFHSGRAADLAGGLFQRQAIGQLAAEKLPQNEASPICLKLMVVRRADRAAGQRRGSNRRRILRTEELHPDRGCYRRLRLLILVLVVSVEYQRTGDGLPSRGLRVIGRFIPRNLHANPETVDGLDDHNFRQVKPCKGRAEFLLRNGIRLLAALEGVFDDVDLDRGLRLPVAALVSRREYHRHNVLAQLVKPSGRALLEGERAGNDGIRPLDLCHAVRKNGASPACGSHLEDPIDEHGIVGQRKIAVFPPEDGRLRDLRLHRVGLQRDLYHASEVGALGYDVILLKFGAVDRTVDGLLLIRIGVVV